MTRDGTVGRSDATERSLTFRWDVDPVRMMRPRFADPIRASSRFGLHQQAGHMTALLCGTPNYLLPGGGHPHMNRREVITVLAGAAAAWPIAARGQQPAERMRRIGVFFAGAADASDTDTQSRLVAFQQGLQQLGWSDGRNIQIEYRFGGEMQPSFANLRRNWARCRRTSSSVVAPPRSHHYYK